MEPDRRLQRVGGTRGGTVSVEEQYRRDRSDQHHRRPGDDE
ncbi:hypothetical protein [Actinoallomurus acaciae]|uniref:Uncharacterized protein n=1 Tax=Actinoallomurus acaciae TaxID=502577 RepID=A0ABV5YKL3_9ACTN